MSIITDPLEKLTTKWMWLENVLGNWSFQGIPPITEGASELAQLRSRIAELEESIRLKDKMLEHLKDAIGQ